MFRITFNFISKSTLSIKIYRNKKIIGNTDNQNKITLYQ